MQCAVLPEVNRRFECTGHLEDQIRLRHRFRPAGDPCETSVQVKVFGGVDCDDGEACIALGVVETSTIRRPRGC